MFSRSHFRSIETANTMSKRSRERKTGEEPAFTKPMSICLISRKLLNLKRPSSLGSGAAHVLVNPQLDSESVLGNQNPATCSARNCNNMQISDYLCVVKVFKTNVLILGLLMSTTMKSSVHLGLQYQENLVADKNCRLRGVQDIVRKNVKSDCGQSFGILNVSTMKNTFSLWMRSLSCHDQFCDHRNKFWYSQFWSDEMWKSKMAGGGGNRKRFQFCTDLSGQEIISLRALQGHSGRNLIDPSLQDNVFIPNHFFEYI